MMTEERAFKTTEAERHDAANDFENLHFAPRKVSYAAGREYGYKSEQRAQFEAAYLRNQFAPHIGGLTLAESIVDRQSWQINYVRLPRNPEEDVLTIQSLLLPRLIGGFSVIINAGHDFDDNTVGALISHEIGHSFFYNSASKPPRRINLSAGDQDEEFFCDRFALHLTGIDLRK